MTLQAGATLGPYVIDDLLGRGGRGEVYRAQDRRLSRFVALKVLSPDLTMHGPQFARFQREARTGALLNHPHIANVLDVGCERGIPFVATELLHGETLRARLRHGALPACTAVRYARQITNGLAAAHEMGVAHRDLKPENIFITTDDRVKILDFGLAKCWFEALELLQADVSGSGGAGVVLEQIVYMSPEQVRGDDADDRSDIFSLGVMLYEMLSGAVPFRGRTTIETLNAILNEEPRPLWSQSADISRELDRAVRRCLAKDRADRFQSVRDVEFNLEVSGPSPATALPLPAAPASAQRQMLQTVMRLF